MSAPGYAGSATAPHAAPAIPPRRLYYTLRELLALPRAEQDAILFLQATLAAPDYAADLALPPAERELTAFESLNDGDPVRDGREA